MAKLKSEDSLLFETLRSLLRSVDNSLNLIGFAKVGDPTPPAVLNNAYLVTETGTVFGIESKKGKLLVGNGTSFLQRNISSFETKVPLFGAESDEAVLGNIYDDHIFKMINGGEIKNYEKTIISTELDLTENYNSAATVGNQIWFNKNMIAFADCVLSKIKGKFQAGLVSVYVLNAAGNTLKVVSTFEADEGVNEVFLNIPLAAGELVTTDMIYYRSSDLAWSYTKNGLSVSNKEESWVEISIGCELRINNPTILAEGLKKVNESMTHVPTLVQNVNSIIVGGSTSTFELISILPIGNLLTDFSETVTVTDQIWFNNNLEFSGNYKIVKLKGYFEVGSNSIYILNAAKNTVRAGGTFNVTTLGYNEIDVDIDVLSGENITVEKLHYRSSGYLSKTYAKDGNSVALLEQFTPLEFALGLDLKIITNSEISRGLLTNNILVNNHDADLDAIKNGGLIGKKSNHLPFGNLLTDFSETVTVSNQIWFNNNLEFSQSCKIVKIKGYFEVGSNSIYILNAAKNTVRSGGIFNITTLGYNEIYVDIDVLPGENITVEKLHYRFSGNLSKSYTKVGNSVTLLEEFTPLEFAIGLETVVTQEITGVLSLLSKSSDYENYGNDKFIKIHDFLGGWTLTGFSLIDGKLVSTTANDYCKLNKIYHSDRRFIRIDATIAANSIIKIPVAMWSITEGQGASCFAIDLLNKKLIIYDSGMADDDGPTSESYTTTELVFTAIADEALVGNDFIIELHKDKLTSLLSLYNKTSGLVTTVSHTGWAAGRQNDHYFIQNVSGAITVNSATVWSLYNPDVVFAGDSITEGIMVTNRMRRYAEQFRQNNPNLKVVISARGGDTIAGILLKFESEYNIYRPKKLSVLIGANGGNTSENLQQLKAKCDEIGCKLFLNKVTCRTNDDHIADNVIITALGYPGARFDIATAKDYFPGVDGNHLTPRVNGSLYYDQSLHPNVDGNDKMYQRLRIDIPTL